MPLHVPALEAVFVPETAKSKKKKKSKMITTTPDTVAAAASTAPMKLEVVGTVGVVGVLPGAVGEDGQQRSYCICKMPYDETQ